MRKNLQKSLSLTGFALLSFLIPLEADAALYSGVYVFGDSISDTGRFYSLGIDLGGGVIPISPPYAQKFTNGKVWVEYLQEELGLTPNPLTNFALAGSTTGTTNVTPGVTLPGLTQQIAGFVSAVPVADPNALYVVWAGANDYLGGNQTDVNIPVGNLSNAITALYGVGARRFLIPNLPDLGKLPISLGDTNRTRLSIDHNNLLDSALGNLSLSLVGSDIDRLDTFSLFESAVNDPASFGLTNVNTACLPVFVSGIPIGPPCPNPDQYLFWDNIHPTTRVHSVIGRAGVRALGVPEPSVTLGIVGLGIIATGLRIKQKLK